MTSARDATSAGRDAASVGRDAASVGRRATSAARVGQLWVLRHGQSTANVEGRIVSLVGPRALTEVGLTDLGREQARQAGRDARESGLLGPDTLVITSDFARAAQTAQIFAEEIGAALPVVDERLRERGFGDFDEGPDTAYPQVWEQDLSHDEPDWNVESVASVAERVSAAIEDADQHRGDRDAVLVAHGDILQIALIISAGRAAREHRDQVHLGNAELRPLRLPSGD